MFDGSTYIAIFLVAPLHKRCQWSKVEGAALANKKNEENKKSIPIVLLHGMWHDASYFQGLQECLSQAGYTSYAISLLPGERLLPGGTQKELVADLEQTLQETLPDDQKFVLLGHSQGGLIVQSALRNSLPLQRRALGAVLLGTFPLGWTPNLSHVKALRKEARTMYDQIGGYLWICFFGKLLNTRYTKYIFLLPTTDETKPRMKEYLDDVLQAPSDGLVTVSHAPQAPMPLPLPTLILGADQDCIYPPHLLTSAFQERFPNGQQVIAKDQAHCFVDPGWEESMAEPLMKWLDNLLHPETET